MSELLASLNTSCQPSHPALQDWPNRRKAQMHYKSDQCQIDDFDKSPDPLVPVKLRKYCLSFSYTRSGSPHFHLFNFKTNSTHVNIANYSSHLRHSSTNDIVNGERFQIIITSRQHEETRFIQMWRSCLCEKRQFRVQRPSTTHRPGQYLL